jgi:hypothetical protein
MGDGGPDASIHGRVNRVLGRQHLARINQDAYAWCAKRRPQLLGNPLTTIDYMRSRMNESKTPADLEEEILAASHAYLTRREQTRVVQVVCNVATLSVAAPLAWVAYVKGGALTVLLATLASVVVSFLVTAFVRELFLDSHKDRSSKWKGVLDDLWRARDERAAATSKGSDL